MRTLPQKRVLAAPIDLHTCDNYSNLSSWHYRDSHQLGDAWIAPPILHGTQDTVIDFLTVLLDPKQSLNGVMRPPMKEPRDAVETSLGPKCEPKAHGPAAARD
jgi:hypothetical protein